MAADALFSYIKFVMSIEGFLQEGVPGAAAG
jgi:hypothetical protein